MGDSHARWAAGASAVNETYLRTARLLTQIAPIVFADNDFALKGGTAINLFYRDLPRLSVDLDLVFRDHGVPRADALQRIDAGIRAMSARLRARGFITMKPVTINSETKLVVQRDNISVKVEVNTVMRGTVHSVRMAGLTATASETLKADLELPVTSLEDTYGGKLAAAMDRQHPRDLFDVMQLFANEGITPAIRRAFVVYVASHNRPVHEVLFPRARDITLEYSGAFAGMTTNAVPLQDLLVTRTRMMHVLQTGLDAEERRFLISLVAGAPDWDVLRLPHIAQLPAVQWKLLNLERLKRENPGRFAEQREQLHSLLV
jgi:predicted nucleotidyltransferase component of viral defense system